MPYKVAVLIDDASRTSPLAQEAKLNICDALEQAGHEPVLFEANSQLTAMLRHERPDVALNATSGKSAVDGSIQSLMDLLGIPCVGSSASILRQACDKSALPTMLRRFQFGEYGDADFVLGVRIPKSVYEGLGGSQALDLIAHRIPAGYPLVVRAGHQGTNVKPIKVDDPAQLGVALAIVYDADHDALVEEWVDGVHLAVGVLGHGPEAFALPPVELTFDEDGTTVATHAPVRMESLSGNEANAQGIRSEIERAALEVHRAYSARDLSCIDIIWDGASARVLEINLAPSLAPSSGFTLSCATAGISLKALLNELIEQAIARG